ncbi:hypothetical protein REPUB_Repub09cG0142800 [Reevesia pubescens]
MSSLLGLELSVPINTKSLLFCFNKNLPPTNLKIPLVSSASYFPCKLKPRRSRSKESHSFSPPRNLLFNLSLQANSIANAEVEEQVEVEVAEGYTMTQFCDKIIDVFLNEKPRVKEWKKYLILREEWNKYKESFYNRCRIRADKEIDPTMKQKLISLEIKVKKIDDEMERHSELLKKIQDSPTDINAIITRRRKDFTDEFFRYLTLVSETYGSLEDRDGVARLAARCLSAVGAYDKTLEAVENLDAAQAKFDDILNSPSVDVACEKIKSLAKAKELDSSLILLINSAWASAKESTTMKNEVSSLWCILVSFLSYCILRR